MNPQTRCAWLALALGPHPTRRALLCVKDPRAELEGWWAHREAFGEWPSTETPEQLLAVLDRQLRRLSRRGAEALLAVDLEYPTSLRAWQKAPAVIFCWGTMPGAAQVAVVGSRAASAAGVEASRELGSELARAGCCVLSGGAIGVDGAAHQGALSAGGPSVAVLGSGLDHLYPERHGPLFARLAARGAVLSSFAPWAPPRRWQFPRRNEVIARLARLVVVVEAGAASGALITARLARAAGVPVLARPGSPGAERLLRAGAGVITGAGDVLTVLAGGPVVQSLVRPEDPDAARSLEELGCRGALSVEELASVLGWAVPRAGVALMRLQLGAFVELGPGGRYVAATDPEG